MNTPNPTHIMIDLETLDTKPTAAVLAIGAVRFDPKTGYVDETNTFYHSIEQYSAKAGRTVSKDTMDWWAKQTQEARDAAFNGTSVMRLALKHLWAWMHGRDNCVWGNGATFDISIMESLFTTWHMDAPWKYYNVRDMRTVKEILKHAGITPNVPQNDLPHHALRDAIHQAHFVGKGLAELYELTNPAMIPVMNTKPESKL